MYHEVKDPTSLGSVNLFIVSIYVQYPPIG